jgi:hypothetical protein
MQQLYELVGKYNPIFIKTEKELSEPNVFLLTEKEVALVDELELLSIKCDLVYEKYNTGPNEKYIPIQMPNEITEVNKQINDVYWKVKEITEQYIELNKGIY